MIPTRRGKPVRLDFVVQESEPPGRRSWTQELAGTPFERLLRAWTTTITVQRDGDEVSFPLWPTRCGKKSTNL